MLPEDERRYSIIASFVETSLLALVLYIILWWVLESIGLHLLLNKESHYPDIIYQGWYFGTFVGPYVPAVIIYFRYYRQKPGGALGSLSGCVLGTIVQAIIANILGSLSIG